MDTEGEKKANGLEKDYGWRICRGFKYDGRVNYSGGKGRLWVWVRWHLEGESSVSDRKEKECNERDRGRDGWEKERPDRDERKVETKGRWKVMEIKMHEGDDSMAAGPSASSSAFLLVVEGVMECRPYVWKWTCTAWRGVLEKWPTPRYLPSFILSDVTNGTWWKKTNLLQLMRYALISCYWPLQVLPRWAVMVLLPPLHFSPGSFCRCFTS